MNIIELAKEAGFGDSFAEVYEQRLERFAALVRAEALAEQIPEWVDVDDYEEPSVSDGVCGGCAKTAADGWALYCVECWEKAEPVKQEPVAHYKDAPHTIYLQTGCEDPEFCECSFNEWGDTTWCKDQIHDTDIPYIRADYAAPVDAKAIREEDK